MAKTTTPPADASTEPKKAQPEKSDREKCEVIIRALYGYGIPGSKKMVRKMDDELVAKILTADNQSKRREISYIIARHNKPSTKPSE